MRFIRPLDDVLANTLSVLNGVLDRLDYVAQMRQVDGTYRHWGLTQEYGKDVTDRVLGEVHHINLVEALRTPIHTLLDEVRRTAKAQGTSVEQYIARLIHDRAKLRVDVKGLAPAHLDHVLDVLLRIARAQLSEQTLAA